VTFLLFLMLAAGTPKEATPETYTYWIEPCGRPEAECEASDVQLAEWALAAWQKAASGTLKFEKSPLTKARIRLYWASSGNQGLYGEARPITVEGKSGAEVNVRPGLHALGHKVAGEGSKDALFRDSIVYLTCLHELGHALGLSHTRSFSDIMYSFENGGNILEYFGRYRRTLKTQSDIPLHSGFSAEDQKRLLAIYQAPAKEPK
jgi:predicted Zn-dependent protease